MVISEKTEGWNMEKTFTKYDKFTIYRDIGYALFTCTGIAVSA